MLSGHCWAGGAQREATRFPLLRRDESEPERQAPSFLHINKFRIYLFISSTKFTRSQVRCREVKYGGVGYFKGYGKVGCLYST